MTTVAFLRDTILATENGTLSLHENFRTISYPVSVKSPGILHTLHDLEADIMFVSYVCKEKIRPFISLHTGSRQLTDKTQQPGNILGFLYLPIQPKFHDPLYLKTDRMTEGTLVVTYADRINNLETPHYVVHPDRVRVLVNHEGCINIIPYEEKINHYSLWHDIAPFKEKIHQHIINRYQITGKSKDRVQASALLAELKDIISDIPVDLIKILSELGIEKKRFTEGVCFYGLYLKTPGQSRYCIWERIKEHEKTIRLLKEACHALLSSVNLTRSSDKKILSKLIADILIHPQEE